MAYAVVVTPKPSAPCSAWLQEWRAYGPFHSRDGADARAATVRARVRAGTWHVRVVPLLAELELDQGSCFSGNEPESAVPDDDFGAYADAVRESVSREQGSC